MILWSVCETDNVDATVLRCNSGRRPQKQSEMPRDRSSSESDEIEKMETEEVVCPYDDEHRVSPPDYFPHVAKCRKEHYLQLGTTIRLLKCPFNGRHFIPEPERHMHEALCPDRKLHEHVVALLEAAPSPSPLEKGVDDNAKFPLQRDEEAKISADSCV
uniref:CHHC U11-48K-type domain-containing protein n=1 Tax=Steinernema glaseri TaxID=37863 RepID=A0A1I7ZTT7_9BILA